MKNLIITVAVPDDFVLHTRDDQHILADVIQSNAIIDVFLADEDLDDLADDDGEARWETREDEPA